MSEGVLLPVWLVVVMSVAAIASIYRHVLAPLARIYLRARERNLNVQLRSDLSRQIPEVLKIGRKARVELFANRPEVKQAITDAVAQGQGTREVLEYKVLEYANELTPGFYSLFYFKIGYLLARCYIRLLYELKIAKPPPQAIANIPEDTSIVLVGNHRSNLDVMMLAYISSRTNMVSFAAGEWGKAWPMSTVLHLAGSYIIRRNEPLPLYRKILAMHLRNMVKVKLPQGIFLEGGLTRDGSIQSVKLGLMSYILSAMEEPNVKDIVFVPVAFNYDQVPEDKALLKNHEQGFSERSKLHTVFSTLWSVLAVIYKRVRSGKVIFGNAAVSFGEPLSMNAWLHSNDIVRPMGDLQKREIVAPVADEIIRQIEDIIPVLPVSLVSTIFINSPQGSQSEEDVLRAAINLLPALAKARAVLIFGEDQLEEAVNSGLDLLLGRGVLIKDYAGYRVDPQGQDLLRYLYNSTKHLMV
jgi:glycerol-3-phosphate O-acyltransferase